MNAFRKWACGAALLFLLGGMDFSSAGTTYYVSGEGSDANKGTRATSPFRTIQRAADLAEPGDTVLVMSGIYSNAGKSDPVVTLRRSGAPEAWIRFKAHPGHQPRLSFHGWAGFYSKDANYIEISGFVIEGNNDRLTYEDAFARKDEDDPRCNGSGISIEGPAEGANWPHHYRIRDNSVSKCGGGGIVFVHADYVRIEGNRVFDNGWYTRYANSGISVYQMRNFDAEPGYRIRIERNVVYNNRTLIPWAHSGKLSDGNGIIIDDSRHTQAKSPRVAYTGRTLVANNLCAGNGGSGIHAYCSEHVDIVNNTAWHNSRKLDYGEIYANNSDDVRIINNICVAGPRKPLNSDHRNGTVLYESNLFFGSDRPAVEGKNALWVDPLFVSPGTDPQLGDFHLQPGSPALDSASPGFAPEVDLDGRVRPQGARPDRGAYEAEPHSGGS